MLPKAVSDIWLKLFLFGGEVGHFENYLPTMYEIPSRDSYEFRSCGL